MYKTVILFVLGLISTEVVADCQAPNLRMRFPVVSWSQISGACGYNVEWMDGSGNTIWSAYLDSKIYFDGAAKFSVNIYTAPGGAKVRTVCANADGSCPVCNDPLAGSSGNCRAEYANFTLNPLSQFDSMQPRK